MQEDQTMNPNPTQPTDEANGENAEATETASESTDAPSA